MASEKDRSRKKNCANSRFSFSAISLLALQKPRALWWQRSKNKLSRAGFLLLGCGFAGAIYLAQNSPSLAPIAVAQAQNPPPTQQYDDYALPESDGDEAAQRAEQAPPSERASVNEGASGNESASVNESAMGNSDNTDANRMQSLGRNERPCMYRIDRGPEMQVIPGGVFAMASAAGKPNRELNQDRQYVVAVQPFALARCELSVAEFTVFVDATAYVTAAEQEGGCQRAKTQNAQSPQKANWRDPGFAQTPNSPVVCLSRRDIAHYLQWLSARLAAEYRLPTEAEWEYAARAGSQGEFAVADADTVCDYANLDDGCDDGYDYTAPVASFLPNRFGLFDMHGNVFEWVADCWQSGDSGAAKDDAAWQVQDKGNCEQGVVRGGAWHVNSGEAGTAYRARCPGASCNYVGFRLARTL